MRLVPVLLAIAVSAFLYFWVLDRETLYSAIGISPKEDLQTEEVIEDDTITASGIIKVVTLHSQSRMIDSAVVLRGQTEAIREVDVRSETSATVISEPLRKGTFVEAGQDMCVLDPGTRFASVAEASARLKEAVARKSEAEARVPETAARVREAEARLEEAVTNENAAIKLSQGGFASDTRVKNARASVAAAQASVEGAQSGLSATQSGIESAEAGIESAQAAVAAAEKEIERLTIKAPFAGVLESDTAELGTLLQPGSLCGTVVQLDKIKLVAFVPETEVARVRFGALAGARLVSSGDKEVRGTVGFLSRSADPTTRTFRVEIEIPNEDLAIRDGQTAEILIASDGANAHLLPSSSLTLNDDGVLGVRIVDTASNAQFVPVQLVRDTIDGVWVTGLPDTADVIVVGQEWVTSGVKVAPTPRETKS